MEDIMIGNPQKGPLEKKRKAIVPDVRSRLKFPNRSPFQYARTSGRKKQFLAEARTRGEARRVGGSSR